MSISDRITELRVQRGINVTQLLCLADISWVTYKRLCAGENVKETTLQRIADALRTTPQYILTGDSSEQSELLPAEIDVAVLAQNIKRLRGSRNWRGTDLAKRAGVSYYTLVNLENVRMTPAKSTLFKIAHAFGVTPMELCSATFTEQIKKSEVLSLGQRLKALRLQNGYSRGDLEQISLISYMTIKNIEHGNTLTPTPKIVQALSEALHVTPRELVDGGSIDVRLLEDVLMCTEEYSPKIDILIQQERLKRGLSVGELAKLSGLSNTAIERAEYGVVYPSYLTLVKLAKALNLQPKELIRRL